ncbi:helix-turn-helix domain-containing protein [Tsuneonella sp. HG222]
MPVTEVPFTRTDFTDRQVEIMDLLARHMTSKQIGQELGISPSSVDKHILRASHKLGLSDRNAAAREWADMQAHRPAQPVGEAARKLPPQFSPLDPQAGFVPSELRDLPGSPLFTVHDAAAFGDWVMPRRRRPVLEKLDENFGVFGRVAAVVVLAGFLAMTIVLSLAIADGIDRLI